MRFLKSEFQNKITGVYNKTNRNNSCLLQYTKNNPSKLIMCNSFFKFFTLDLEFENEENEKEFQIEITRLDLLIEHINKLKNDYVNFSINDKLEVIKFTNPVLSDNNSSVTMSYSNTKKIELNSNIKNTIKSEIMEKSLKEIVDMANKEDCIFDIKNDILKIKFSDNKLYICVPCKFECQEQEINQVNKLQDLEFQIHIRYMSLLISAIKESESIQISLFKDLECVLIENKDFIYRIPFDFCETEKKVDERQELIN